MKIIPYLILLLVAVSCSSSEEQKEKPKKKEEKSAKIETPQEKEVVNPKKTEGIPADGTYLYDIAFSEYRGESMGEKVTVIISGDSIKVVYEGDGNLSNAKAGTVFGQGMLRKHKSGRWIISQSPEDTEIDEVGGCTDGPEVIDFEEEKFWMC